MLMKQLLVSVLVMSAAVGAWAAEAGLHHILDVRIDPADRSLHVVDTIEGGVADGDLWLHPGHAVTGFSVDGSPVIPFQGTPDGRLPVPVGAERVEVAYRIDIGDDRWPYLVLGAGEGWYPERPGAMVTFELRLTAPETWASLTQGVPDPADPRRWRQRDPQRAIYLVAGPWQARSAERGDLRAATFLIADEPALSDRYLEAALDAMQSYSGILGAYPYHSFTLVENRQQTGWGFPGFTLLGSEVIRLPFIVHTSFPHEVLHNWWGNGVFADRSAGNWSEGLTTYLSDHLFRERSGQGRQYRFDALVNWQDFTGGNRDFPLAEFRGRHDRATQAVGYGRGMFLFHMLRRRLGDDRFLAALADLYREYLFREAGFSDIRGVFERECGCDLEGFFDQWLHRTGAPLLSLEVTGQAVGAVDLRLRQEADAPWHLDVPVRLTDVNGVAGMHRLRLDSAVADFRLPSAMPVARVEVDPEVDLFRRLHAEERPATFSAVFGAGSIAVNVAGIDGAPMLQEALLRGRSSWTGGGDGDAGARVWVGLDHPEARRELPAAGIDLALEAQALMLDGTRIPLTDDVVVAVAAWLDSPAGRRPVLWLATRRADGLERLLQRLPRYGRFSYAVFEQAASRATVTGQWQVREHPLSVTLRQAVTPPEAPPAPLF